MIQCSAGVVRRAALLVAVVIGLAIVPACQIGNNCPSVVAQPWWGAINSESVQLPGYQGATLTGTIFEPADTTTYPGRRPVVIDDHGINEDECHQWWSAWALAGHGYVVLTFTATTQPQQLPETEDAVNWVLSTDNPYLTSIDPDQVALVGHSAGNAAIEAVQTTDTRVKAFVALDNMHRMTFGCPDVPGANPTATEQTPRVPGLGLARDGDCSQQPATGDPEFPDQGFEHWRAAGVPTAMFVLAGSVHLDYETNGNDLIQQRAFYAMQAWFDYWLQNDPTGLDRLSSTTWNGTDRSAIVSTYFRSGIDVPAYTCLDLRVDCPPTSPDTPAPAATPGLHGVSPAPSSPTIPLDQPLVLGPPDHPYQDDTAFTTGR